MTTTLPQTGAAPVVKRFPWGGLIVLAVAVFLSVTAEMIPTGLLPEMSSSLGVSESQTGLLISVFAFAVVLTSVPLTFLFRRIPRHLLLMLVLVAIAISSTVGGLAPNFEVLVGARVVGGMAHGVFWGVVGAYSAHLVPRDQIGRAVAITTGGGTLAFVLGVPLATAVGHAWGWRVPFFGIGALALLGAVFILLLLPRVDHRKHLAPSTDTRALRVARRHAPLDPTIPVVALICILVAVIMIGNYAFYTYIAPFMIGQMGVPEGQVGLLLLVYGGAGAIGVFAAGAVFGRRPTTGLVVALAATGVSVLLLAVFAANPVVAIGAFFVWGVAFGVVPTLLPTRLMHAASPEIRDTSSAFYSSAFNAGIGIGALVGSLFLDSLGLTSLPWIYLIALVLAGGLLAATPALTRRARRV
ncbi:MFS transporter [Herbiconiux ginsengi]|uniref:Predicted arabinose efflux permease, MFS family n=1 Tax=Herbiconiux ginsengi TaxID=381665 RepID=A0A1H3JRR8_9MICO|nr:MFS transporter [Herbiconiux ginsengi]SDY42205.1 Predicted arabinose efflux permease, MFS family [Herbiconiux ginsengi]